MTTTITPEELYFGAPASLTYDGVECGATIDAPKVSFQVENYTPEFQNAKGPIVGTVITRRVIPSVEFTVNQLTAQKLAWAMPGSTSTSSQAVGSPVAGLDTTLAADPALGATNLKVASVTTVAEGDFIRVAAPGVAATEANSEVVRVLTVGTTGGGGTGLDVENDAGGGMRIDHANASEVKTVSATILAAPAAAGDVVVKVDAVSPFIVGDFIRIGDYGHYEIREIATKGTLGPGGTGLGFAVPLSRDHGLDAWVIKVTTSGTTAITWTPGRIDSSAYNDLVLVGSGLDGRTITFTLNNAMSAENQELEFSDNAVAGLKVKFTGYYTAATPTLAPFQIELD